MFSFESTALSPRALFSTWYGATLLTVHRWLARSRPLLLSRFISGRRAGRAQAASADGHGYRHRKAAGGLRVLPAEARVGQPRGTEV